MAAPTSITMAARAAEAPAPKGRRIPTLPVPQSGSRRKLVDGGLHANRLFRLGLLRPGLLEQLEQVVGGFRRYPLRPFEVAVVFLFVLRRLLRGGRRGGRTRTLFRSGGPVFFGEQQPVGPFGQGRDAGWRWQI